MTPRPLGFCRLLSLSNPAPCLIIVALQALGLDRIGIGAGKLINYNLTYPEIAAHEDIRGVNGQPAVRTKTGSIVVDTGKFTGRSPKDKYIVKEDATREDV